MLNWLKKILGIGPSVPAAIEAAIPAPEEKPKTKKATTKTKVEKSTKKADTKHLQAMTKKELLEFAKLNGIKANASLSKAELVKRVKNG